MYILQFRASNIIKTKKNIYIINITVKKGVWRRILRTLALVIIIDLYKRRRYSNIISVFYSLYYLSFESGIVA